ncbi:hypothetical protein ROG8370_00919 [Roseovarius gaetbuli]|uniref:Uncharacterized protein n=1 Tax=Roseovarius gaetbuli TaxID=1356575 RepID=A0A1X6YM99_9RHOB|nr:hypothetical protein [Roseovarius gaetbuli]SLN25595.1 hypothetical protein ROG8370_00919 [Roseovarius gaetbuli]
MNITKVTVCALKSEVVKRCHSAVFLLENEGGRVTMQSTVTAEEGVDPAALAEALLADAIRQLARLPEYRTGETPITVADGALEGALQGA